MNAVTRHRLGARFLTSWISQPWPFLSDPARKAKKDLEIADTPILYTEAGDLFLA